MSSFFKFCRPLVVENFNRTFAQTCYRNSENYWTNLSTSWKKLEVVCFVSDGKFVVALLVESKIFVGVEVGAVTLLHQDLEFVAFNILQTKVGWI